MPSEATRPWLAAIGDEAAPDLLGQLAAIRQLGWGSVELRSIGGRPLGTVPVSDAPSVAAAVAEAGLRVSGLASNIGAWGRTVATPLELDLAELQVMAAWADATGARGVRVMSWANDGLSPEDWRSEALRRMEALLAEAERLDLVLLHENCAGWGGQGAAESAELAATFASDRLRLLLDTGNCVAYRQDPMEMVEASLPWVGHVHVKDAVGGGDDDDDATYVAPGEGDAQVRPMLERLRDAGYPGGLSLEPHLVTAPHKGTLVSGDEGLDGFLACGRALEALVAAVWGDAPSPSPSTHAQPQEIA